MISLKQINSETSLLDVLAIDIAPAQPSVIKCDFLQVETGHRDLIEDNSLKSLKCHSYDAVLFCLLLGTVHTMQCDLKTCIHSSLISCKQ